MRKSHSYSSSGGECGEEEYYLNSDGKEMTNNIAPLSGPVCMTNPTQDSREGGGGGGDGVCTPMRVGEEIVCVMNCHPFLPNSELEKETKYDPPLWRKLIAEGVGTFILMVLGTGVLISHSGGGGGGGGGGVPLISAQWVWGGVVLGLIVALGPISGAHFNPQVTLAFVLTRATPVAHGVGYVLCQILGSIAGSGFLYLLYPLNSSSGSGGGGGGGSGGGSGSGSGGVYKAYVGHAACGSLAMHLTPVAGMWVEAMGTAILVSIILLAAVFPPRSMRTALMAGPLAISLTLVAIIGWAGPLTSAGLNYARILGPAIVFHCWEDHWIWLVGDTLGALLAVLLAIVLVPGLWDKISAPHMTV